MAGQYNEGVARTVQQGAVSIVATEWKPLVSSGSTPLEGRRHVKLFNRSKTGQTLALAYSQKNLDGTFDTPTTDVRVATVYPGNSYVIEPVGDAVNIYGRLLLKDGEEDSSGRVIVTEYA